MMHCTKDVIIWYVAETLVLPRVNFGASSRLYQNPPQLSSLERFFSPLALLNTLLSSYFIHLHTLCYTPICCSETRMAFNSSKCVWWIKAKFAFSDRFTQDAESCCWAHARCFPENDMIIALRYKETLTYNLISISEIPAYEKSQTITLR